MAEVALFDLDGVLTRGDTMASLVGRRLLQRPFRLLKAVPLFLLSLIAPPDWDLKSTVNRKLVALALKGLTDDDYAQLAATTGQFLASKPSFVNKHMVTLCHDSAVRGRAIVVTASERRLARAYLDGVGLNAVELIASDLGGRGQDLFLARHNVAAAKLAKLTEAGVNLAASTFYTDSATDIPVAAAAGKTFIVNAGLRSHRRLQAAVAGTETIRCR